MLMLSVYINKRRCHFPDLRGCHRLPVDPAHTSGARQFAADDDLPVIRMNLQLFKLADRLRRIHGKGKLYKPRIRSFSQHIS